MKTLLYSLFGLSMFTSGSLAETIRITNGEWEPFLSKYSYQYGLDSHIVTEAFKLEGIDIEWGFFPWKRAYQNAKLGGKWHASCCWWPSAETKNDFFISEIITKTSFVFFHLKSYNFDWNSIQDLKGMKIGGTLQYDYGKEYMDAIAAKKLDVEYVTKDEFNYKKLLAGRIQIFPNDPAVGYAQIRNSLPADQASLLTHNPKGFELSSLHLIISKNNKRGQYFLEKFNAGMEKLKASGRYQLMINDLTTGKYDKKKNLWQAP